MSILRGRVVMMIVTEEVSDELCLPKDLEKFTVL